MGDVAKPGHGYQQCRERFRTPDSIQRKTGAIDFVVESDRAQLSEIVQRVRDGRLRTHVGNVSSLDEAVAALNPARIKGKTIIRVRP